MEVRLYDSARDADQLRIFNQHVFGAAQQRNESAPFQHETVNPYGETPGPTAIAIVDDVIVGHLTSTPFGLWCEGKESLAYWLSGFHVLPSTRGSGVGKKLVACLNQALPVLSAAVVVEPSLKAFQANQWIYPGKIHEYLHVVKSRSLLSLLTRERIDRFLPKLLKPLSGLLLQLAHLPAVVGITLLKQFKGVTAQIGAGEHAIFKEVKDFDRDIDTLWEKNKDKMRLTHARNSLYMNWLFPHQRGWKKATRTRDGTTVAWLLYTIKLYDDGGPLHGLKALNVIDALWDMDSHKELDDLVHHVLALGYRSGADLILMSGNEKLLREAVSKAAFIKIPSTVHIGFFAGEKTEQLSSLFENAYITRGYADAAGGLGPA